jgi:hypothetical protein
VLQLIKGQLEVKQMPTQSKMHFYLNWAKERIDEMDAAMASFEGKIGDIQSDARVKARESLDVLRKRRDKFDDVVKIQAEANEAAWVSGKVQLESEWNAFEAETKKYVESFGKKIEQQQATFELQSAALLKAWRAAAEKFSEDVGGFAVERRSEMDATVKRMNADATVAEEKLKKLGQAGVQSWSALMTALTDTRAAFDRANQAAEDAFHRASR